MKRIKQKREKSTIPGDSEIPDFLQCVENFRESDLKLVFTPPFAGFTPSMIPPYDTNLDIEIPEYDGSYTTIHPEYVRKVMKECHKRRNFSLLNHPEIQEVLAYCNYVIEFYDKLRRGVIKLDSDAPPPLPFVSWEEAEKWCRKTVQALSTGLTYKAQKGALKKEPLPPELKEQYQNLCSEFEGYLRKKYSYAVEERKIHGKPYLLIKKLGILKPALKDFPPIKDGTYPNIKDVIDQYIYKEEKKHLINTSRDLVIHILAKKYKTNFHRIKRELTKIGLT